MKIVVAGDMARDVVFFPRGGGRAGDASSQSQNWEMFPSHGEKWFPGGAELTRTLIEQLAQGSAISVELQAEVPEDRRLRSYVHVGLFHRTLKDKAQKAKERVWRVSEWGGYSAPDRQPRCGTMPTGAVSDAALLVLDDAGNGFRDCAAAQEFVQAAKAARVPILLKMSRPVAGALEQPPPLVTALQAARPDGPPVVLALNMWDLRADGMDVSQSLSWERTAADFACSLLVDGRFAPLASLAQFMVVHAGLEGALLVDWSEKPERRIGLLYDPSRIEGDIEDETPGKMAGYGAAFVAGLARRLAGAPVTIDSLRDGAAAGLAACRRLAINGYGQTDKKGKKEPVEPSIAPAETFQIIDIKAGPPAKTSSTDRLLAWTYVPVAAAWWKSSPPSWRILNELSSMHVRKLALDMLQDSGTTVEAAGIPVARFENLCALDRFEIEGYRSLRSLIREYMHVSDPPRPLCVAVFGQPGCGKSFGIKQIAKAVMGDKPEILTFNLAEFREVQELKRALHLVHDKTRNGVVPLVFFDEFDCDFDGKLGWLKHLLAPMQDGTFRDAEHEHPIGKAIFVFAGGTSHTFADFAARADGKERNIFVSSKGPDFISRLRGYVDVIGPCPAAPCDFAAILRRAGVLQHNLREHAAKLTRSGLADPEIRVRTELAYALLYTPRIRHGLRSIEAIIQMSGLSGLREFGPSALPSRAQLDLHLDARQFYDLLSASDVVLKEGHLEQMAHGTHEGYRRANWLELKDRGEDDHSKLPWPAGTRRADGTVDSNFQQVELIPLRVAANGYQVVRRERLKAFSAAASFTPRRLEALAREEHERWNAQKLNAGWRYGPMPGKDEKLRLHHDIVDWAALPAAERRKDLDAIARIPLLLDQIGYAVTDIRPPDPSPAGCPPGRTAPQKECGDPADSQKEAPCFEAYALVRKGQDQCLVVDRQGCRMLPGGAVGPDQRVDLALAQRLSDAAGASLRTRLTYEDCEIGKAATGAGEKSVLLFLAELMDEQGNLTQNPDWPNKINGASWRTLAELAGDASVDPAVRKMLSRLVAWDGREEKYR